MTYVRTVLLIGVENHACQCPPTGSSGHGTEPFRALVVAMCHLEGVKAIAEEMSIEALEDYGVRQSIGHQVADALHIAHRYCDPSRQEREARGIFGESDIRMAGFMANSEPHEIEAAIQDAFARRELYWLAHVLQLDTWPVLFICGANHTETFRALLQATDIVVHVLFTRWQPQERGD